MAADRLIIFDTTLRDGEQSPGFSMNTEEKIRLGRQIATLGADIIEAGFPIASDDDAHAVSRIATEIQGPVIAALARCNPADIDRAGESLAPATRSRIHTFIATSDLHLERKLRISREQCLAAVTAGVTQARSYTDDVEFSAEDATRSDLDFLCRVVDAAIAAGATTINLPDTVGYCTPEEIEEFFTDVRGKVRDADQVIFSAHCHDDLGLAVANSLAAMRAGCRQVECTINGIGERAGNASLEEIVMATKVKPERVPFRTSITTTELVRTSRLLSELTEQPVQANKAIVGRNAFAHEAGIHQDGVIKDRRTYEIMKPEDVGVESTLVLGKHSGRHAVKKRCEDLGYTLSRFELDRVYREVIALADRQKTVEDDDVAAIVERVRAALGDAPAAAVLAGDRA
ncbi:MAG: 2-isopropylmalate synthase [Acidobacteria bacterium]|nr:2-isopropylmalate synthase [Acidobacteriota bacterium]MYJ04720.1 2-isopropylmalate synthase [Acidobacteriota bacterium]